MIYLKRFNESVGAELFTNGKSYKQVYFEDIEYGDLSFENPQTLTKSDVNRLSDIFKGYEADSSESFITYKYPMPENKSFIFETPFFGVTKLLDEIFLVQYSISEFDGRSGDWEYVEHMFADGECDYYLCDSTHGVSELFEYLKQFIK